MGHRPVPAVHSVIEFQMGDKTVEVPNVADASRIGGQKNANGDIIARNFPLTPAVPFNGGLIKLSAGLARSPWRITWKPVSASWETSPRYLNVPQVSSVIGLAQPLASGVQEVMAGGNGQLHLSLHNSYAAGELKAGYFAAIAATEKQVDATKLWVVDGELREGTGLGPGKNVPFTRFDHMLFRVDVFEERDDIESLSAIYEPFQQALDELLDPATEARSLQFLRTAQIKAGKAAELTIADRRRLPAALEEEYNKAKRKPAAKGLVGSKPRSLTNAVKGVMTVKKALQKGEPTLEEIFAGKLG